MSDVFDCSVIDTGIGKKPWVATLFLNGSPILSRSYSKKVVATQLFPGEYLIYDYREYYGDPDSPKVAIDRLRAPNSLRLANQTRRNMYL